MRSPTYIIAEIAQGFEGNEWLCKKYIELAKKSGADAVKFQIFKADELATHEYQYYELFRSLEIAPEKWISLIQYANAVGIDFLSDIYGTETLAWIRNAGIKGIKIHSTDIMNYPLLRAVRETGLKIFLATGGSSLEEIENALQITGTSGIALLSGFQAEPNLTEDLEIDKIRQLSMKFGVPVGYADHVDPSSELAIVLPSLAVVKGASIIEKHLTIDRDHLQLEDYVSALNPDEFAKMVSLVRSVEALPVTENYVLSNREKEYRTRTKRSIVVHTQIQKGEAIRHDTIALLRTGSPGDFYDMNEVVGKTVNRSIKAGEILKKEDIA